MFRKIEVGFLYLNFEDEYYTTSMQDIFLFSAGGDGISCVGAKLCLMLAGGPNGKLWKNEKLQVATRICVQDILVSN